MVGTPPTGYPSPHRTTPKDEITAVELLGQEIEAGDHVLTLGQTERDERRDGDLFDDKVEAHSLY
jgi:hypothetical protein